MFGHRPDGKRVRGLDPIVEATPYLMPMRCDSQVFLQYDIEYEPMMRYVAEKGRQGLKITFMELVIAAYVRAISQVPEVNRFIMNKQFFNRTQLSVSLTLLMDTKDGSLKENAIKVKFDPSDTIFDVSARMKAAIEKARKEEDPGFTLKLASTALKIPGLANVLVALIRLLDRYGLCPGALLDELPFHTSMFITNMASIGMMRVFHHIYNFGSTSLFFSMGVPERGYTVNAKGETIRRCTLPIGATADERVCGGSTYALLFASIKHSLAHPEELEKEPETVKYNEGAEYHVPKPVLDGIKAKV